MYSIVRTPEFTRADGSVCQISNGFNSVFIDLQRQDSVVSGIFNNSGKLGVVVNDNSIYTDKCYLFYNHATGTYSGVFDILIVGQIVIGFVTFDVLILDTAFIPHTFVDGFANSFNRKNYKIITYAVINGTTETTEREFTPDNTGLVRVYVDSMLKDYFSKTYEPDYTVMNEVATDHVLTFRIQAKEQYQDYEGTFAYLTGTWRAAKSVAQVGENNLMEEFEVYYSGVGVYSTAKFLTAFKEPVMWDGFPFSLSFLRGVSSLTVQKVVNGVAANLTVQSARQIHTMPLALTDDSTVYLQTGSGIVGSSLYAIDYAIDYAL